MTMRAVAVGTRSLVLRAVRAGGSRRRSVDGLVILLFLAAVGAPTLDLLLRAESLRSPETHEARAKASRPDLPRDVAGWSAFPAEYAAHFDDTFGMRDRLIRWNTLEKLFLFGVSPTPTVVLGRDRWMFYVGDRSLEVHRGLAPMTFEELERWRIALTAERDWCRLRGIDWIFALGPNKESIYADRLPAELNRIGPTRLDQLVAHLRARSDVEILDLREPLLAARAECPPDDPLYFALGTHWSGRGAWIAANAIAARIAARFPAVAPLARAQTEIVPAHGIGDTWGYKMYVRDLPQVNEVHRPRVARARVDDEGRYGFRRVRRTSVDDPGLPRGVLFHDSFGASLDPLLSEHFSHLAAFWRYEFDTEAIEAERPDVVLVLFVERFLQVEHPGEFGPKAEVDLERAFAWSKDVRLRLDVAADAARLSPLGSTAVRAGEDAIEIEERSGGDTFLLPEVDLSPAGRPVIAIDITSPADTNLRLFYRRPGDADYSRGRSVVAALRRGRNRVFLALEEPGLAGRWMVRPGDEPGLYRLHELEVRSR